MSKINIIGAGISGLAAAVRFLSESPENTVEIFEASNSAGGRLKPLSSNRFKTEIINPHLIAKCNHNVFTFLKIINAPMPDLIKFKTFNYNPVSLFKLFAESVTNTPYELCDKKMALKILLMTLKSGFNFYYANPRDFINPALDFIKSRRGTINYNSKISSLSLFDKKNTILAVDAFNLKRLLNIDFEIKEKPIVNIHFKYNLKENFTYLCPDFSFPSVIFSKNNTISVTVSAAYKLISYEEKNIINIYWKLLKKLFNINEDCPEAVVIKTKRATVKIDDKDIGKIKNNGYTVCSDFVCNDLPSTIESSVRSGFTFNF